jgi:predicted DNA-binding transcriptional regulator AlpA
MIEIYTSQEIRQKMKLPQTTFYRMRQSGRFAPEPLECSGRTHLFSADEVNKWFRAGCPGRVQWKKQRGIA